MARETEFVERSTSKIQGDDFIQLLTTDILENPYISLNGLCDILFEINPNAKISPQGLSDRINSDEAVSFLKTVLEGTIQKNLMITEQNTSNELFSFFNRVFIEDSSQCELNEKLADEFKGSGGSASKSSLKINLIYELITHIIQDMHITDVKEPDQKLATRVLNHLKKNDLIIRDLGYFSLEVLAKISLMGAFFLSRLLKGVKLYFPNQKESINADYLGQYLSENFKDQTVIDIDVLLGEKEKLISRLIAYKLPDKVVNERIRKANQNAKKKGRELSKGHINWLNFGFYITNVGRDVWLSEVVGTIYRIRWRIELIFKSWKSLLKIHVLKGTRPERIKCMLYGRLITITIMTMLYSFAYWYAENMHKREVSAHKFFDWLKRKDRISKAVFSGFMDKIVNSLKTEILGNCKQKRKRKTTVELIQEGVPYLQSFDKKLAIPEGIAVIA